MAFLENVVHLLVGDIGYFGEDERRRKWNHYSDHSPQFQKFIQSNLWRYRDRITFNDLTSKPMREGLAIIKKLEKDEKEQELIKKSIDAKQEREKSFLEREKRRDFLAFQNIEYLIPILRNEGRLSTEDLYNSLTHISPDRKVIVEKMEFLIRNEILNDWHKDYDSNTRKFFYTMSISQIHHPYKIDKFGKPILIYDAPNFFPKLLD